MKLTTTLERMKENNLLNNNLDTLIKYFKDYEENVEIDLITILEKIGISQFILSFNAVEECKKEFAENMAIKIAAALTKRVLTEKDEKLNKIVKMTEYYFYERNSYEIYKKFRQARHIAEVIKTESKKAEIVYLFVVGVILSDAYHADCRVTAKKATIKISELFKSMAISKEEEEKTQIEIIKKLLTSGE